LRAAARNFPSPRISTTTCTVRELELIFQHGPRYVGHELAVPEVGDYHALAHEGEGRALIRTSAGLQLVSNVCRHRQAVMLRGRGQHRAAHRLPPAPLDLRPQGAARRRRRISPRIRA